MSPKEDGPSTKMNSSPESSSAGFWDRLGNIPLVKSTFDMYEVSKHEHTILRTALGVMEFGVKIATKPLHIAAVTLVEAYPDKGNTS